MRSFRFPSLSGSKLQTREGNMVDFPRSNSYELFPASGNSLNIELHSFIDHNGINPIYGDLYNHQHPMTNLEFVAPPNLSHHLSISPPSNGVFRGPVNNGSSDQMLLCSSYGAMVFSFSENSSNTGNIIESSKRNNLGVPVNSSYVDGSKNSSSDLNLTLNSELQPWSEPFEDYANSPDPFEDGILPMAEGSHESLRGGPREISPQLQSASVHHYNHLFQAAYMAPYFPVPGRRLNRGLLENGNIGSSGCQDVFSSRNPAANGLPFPVHNHHQQHTLPVEDMHGFNYSHRQPASDGHSVNNNRHHGIINPSSYFSSNPSESLSQASTTYNDGDESILYPEDTGNLSDEHLDMRLDIDDMSYEELLDLEEQIGNVTTGLSEESILRFLKTRKHFSPITALSIQTPCISSENGTCVICQVELKDDEIVGTLDCGHDYHEDCIRPWLLMKNQCPICKATGLSMDGEKEGIRIWI